MAPICFLITAFGLLGVLPLSAQDTPTPIDSIAALEAEAMIVSNALMQAGELAPTNDFGSNQPIQAEDLSSDTNEPNNTLVPPAERESRRQWLLRQRAGSLGSAGEPGAVGGHGQTNSAAQTGYVPERPAYAAFQHIRDNNIFDPNRRPTRRGSTQVVRTQRPSESFALVGVMSYDKGTFAFFDGTSSSYRKALKLDDSIAGYRVTHIRPDAVQLATGTNQLELQIGMKLRREADGPWEPGGQAEGYSTASNGPASTSTTSSGTVSTSTTTSQTAAGGADSDVLERLRKKREQE
jgi:hypothetical protein